MSEEQLATAWKAMNIVTFWLGMSARVILPYLKQYFDKSGDLPFDWSYVKGQFIGSLIAFLGLLAVGGNTFLAEVGALGAGLAFITGYFTAQVGREGQKLGGSAQGFWRMEKPR